jgi:hypothetical protein
LAIYEFNNVGNVAARGRPVTQLRTRPRSLMGGRLYSNVEVVLHLWCACQ